MRILIADDEAVSRRVLESTLRKWDYEVVAARDGAEAWQALSADDAPPVAILDVEMPGFTGIELCGKMRGLERLTPVYVILLTGHKAPELIFAGLEAGAHDFVVKPFDRDELRARLQVARRVVELQRNLAERLAELEAALSQVNQLQGMLPICSYCKSVRNDQNYWQRIEAYVAEHTEATFSHGICPDCYHNKVRPELDRELEQRRARRAAD